MNLKENYLYQLNKQIQSKNLNWSAVLTPNDRTFYIDHQNKITSWLPPLESQIWYKYSQPCYEPFIKTVPYAWDVALDDNDHQYYINHLNKTTTYVNPNTYLNNNNEKFNEFRYVTLYKDDKLGFGFVAGSEKPVIVKSIKQNGPAENKLFPNDEILYVNGKCVQLDAQCDVINAIKNSGDVLHLQVAQHYINQANPRASNLTKFKKGNNLKKKKLNVRFAETNLLSNACINPNDPVNKIDENISFTVPNCIKIFFTNGQTKVLRYQPATTINNIIVDILDKLHIKPIFRKHFALCNEIENPMKLNKYGHLDPNDKIIGIASRTDAYKLKIVFRFAFIPGDLISFINTLFVSDKEAFDYLYDQTANDLKTDGLYYSVKSEYIIRLICLHIQQLYLMSNLNTTNNANIGSNDHSIFSFVNLFSNFTRNPTSSSSTLPRFIVNDDSAAAAATNDIKNATTVENCLPNCVTTKDLKKTVKEQLKEIDRIHDLKSIVPEILANSFRNADDLSKALEYYYESNLKDVIPLILHFNLPSTDQQIAIRVNNEHNSDNTKTLFKLFDDDDKLNLNKLKNQLNKPIDHSNVFINKDIVKFCFLTLAAELRDFGNKQFKVKETSLYFKEIVNDSINSEKNINRNNNNEKTIKKDTDKNLKTFNELHQYLNKFKSNTLQPDEIISLNPKLGICHLFKNCLVGPTKLANVDDLISIRISSNLEYNYDYYLNVELNFRASLCSDQPINTINLVMLERIAKEFIICLTGFFKLNIDEEEFKLPIYNDIIKDWWVESSAPDYFSIHNVKQTFWNSPIDLEKLDLLPLLNKENINFEFEENYKLTDFFIKPPAYCECVDKNGKFINDSNKLIYLPSEKYDINNDTNLNSQYYHSNKSDLPFFTNKTSLLIDSLSGNDSIIKNEEEIVEDEKIQSIYDELLNYENDLTTSESITDNTSSSFLILKEDKNNQTLDSLSDSDPISFGNADLSSDSPQPPPGELKQVDSLLLLNQIGNEDIIMNGNILNTDELNMYECESSGTNSSNETPINLQQQFDNCNDLNSLMIELNETNDYLLANKTNISNDFSCMKNCDEMIESNANILVENYANDSSSSDCSSSYKLNYWLLDQSSFTNNESTLDNLDKLIIPPPPKFESDASDALLDKFKKATDDIKKICKEAENESQTVLYQQNEQCTAINRDIHSSSSADSGYDSVLINTTFIDDSKLMECLLFKNYYSSNSSKLNEAIPKLLRNKLIDDLFSDKIDNSEMKLDEDESFFTTRALISRLVCSLDEEFENQYRLINNLMPKDLKINKQDQYINFKNAKVDLWYLSRCFVSTSKKFIKKSTEEPTATSNAEITIKLNESVKSLSELIQCVHILVSNSNDMELNLILTTQTINIARTLVIIIDKVYSMKCLSEQFKKDEKELIANKKMIGNNLDKSTYNQMYKLIDKYGVIGKDYIENDGIMRTYKDLTELLELSRNHASALSEFMKTATKIKDQI